MQIRSANFLDLAFLRNSIARTHFAEILIQMQSGPSFCMLWYGQPAGIVGLVPCRAIEADEIWLLVSRDLRGTRDASAFTRHLVRRMRAFTWSRPILAAIRHDHQPGVRLATAMGFKPAPALPGLAWRYWVRHPLV